MLHAVINFFLSTNMPVHIHMYTYTCIQQHAHTLSHTNTQIWDRSTLQLSKVLEGHKGFVSCLQYNEEVVISGSGDHTVKLVHLLALSA